MGAHDDKSDSKSMVPHTPEIKAIKLEVMDVTKKKKKIVGQRHVLAIIAFLMVTFTLLPRTNISVAMVAMVNYTAIRRISHQFAAANGTIIESYDNDEEGDTCPYEITNSTIDELPDGEFVWTPDVQGIIFGAFYWGKALALVPGGYLGQRFGGKMVSLLGIILLSLSCVLFPLTTQTGYLLPCVIRAFGGVGNAFLQAPTQTVLAKWIPKPERARMSGFIYSGSPLGTMLALGLTGIMTDSGMMGGWPSSFYVFGIVGFVISILWAVFIFESPGVHPWIKEKEQIFIEDSIGVAQKRLPVPWKKILTSRPVWGLLCAFCAYHWSLFTIGALMPTYMRTVLHFNIRDNGFLSSIPYLTRVLVSTVSSWISDKMFKKGVSLSKTRKVMTTIGLTLPAIFICAVPYAGCNRILSVAIMTIGMSLTGTIFCCVFINPVDLSPNFAGAITSITHIPGNVGGVVSPYVAGLILSDLDSLSKWKKVFFILGGVSLVCNIVYIICGSAELQPWNEVKRSKDDLEGGGNKKKRKKKEKKKKRKERLNSTPTALQNGKGIAGLETASEDAANGIEGVSYKSPL